MQVTTLSTQLFDRACRAYSSYLHKHAGIPDQPSRSDSDLAKLDDHYYVVLRNVRGVLAVYRLHDDERLRASGRIFGAVGELTVTWRAANKI